MRGLHANAPCYYFYSAASNSKSPDKTKANIKDEKLRRIVKGMSCRQRQQDREEKIRVKKFEDGVSG